MSPHLPEASRNLKTIQRFIGEPQGKVEHGFALFHKDVVEDTNLLRKKRNA